MYAVYGGRGGRRYVAYVGVTDRLRKRVRQHLINRSSSVTTGTSATGLNPDYVTEVRWWEHPAFSDKATREAAERMASEVFDPSLRSRSEMSSEARRRYDASFRREMRSLFRGDPTGRLTIPNLKDAMERIVQLERRLASLAKRVKHPGRRA